MSEKRKVLLLEKAHELLRLQCDSGIVLNLLEECVHYDGADCDGYCLMEDISNELELEDDE